MDKQTGIDWVALAYTLELEFSSDIIHCNDEYEMIYIKKLLQKEIPDLSMDRVDYVVDQCCKLHPHPCTIREFVGCLRRFVS